MTDIIVYKCPACGGRMESDSKTQHMKCPFCDTELSVEEHEATAMGSGSESESE